jgi:hypothetical protein
MCRLFESGQGHFYLLPLNVLRPGSGGYQRG